MIGGAKGIGIGIDFGIPNQYCRATSKPYIEKDVLDSLRVVASAYGKSNNDADRSIVKNLVDPDNPFVISNAAYDKMSSYGGYEFAKFDNTLDWYNTEGNDSVEVVSRNGHSITLKRLTGPNFWYFQNSTFRGLISNVIPFKVNSNKNITVIWDVHGLSISEGKDKSVRIQELVLNPNEDNYTNLKTLNEEELAQIDISTNSLYYLLWFDLSTLAVDEEVTIEMLPLFEGAFVTDGIDDLITSTKTVQEMLGGSNEITVVSMIHQVKDSSNNVSFTNYIRGSANGYFRNIVNNYDKTGIYGYTSSDLMGLSVVNNILGDKNDYTSNGDNRDSIINGNFSVQGYSYNDGNNTGDFSSVAWYWTIIANKVLTTDQINQVIAYFNLDRTLKSDIYCNIAKQGITNENHAEFGDKLIDFSGNGRDIQLNNIAWDGDSGIGKYNYPNWKVTATIANTYSTIVNYPTVNGTYSINVNGVSELMQSIGLHLEIKYTTSTGIIYNDIKQDGVYSYILPDGATDLTLRFGGIPGIVNEPCNITITQIPSHAGALCLDGVNDFGQFVGDLELKDYTFIADRAYSRIAPSQVPFIASTQTNGQAPFLMEYLNEDTYVYPHSFGTTTKTINLNIQRQISYQSTYVYNGNSISKGISVDTGDGLTIGNSGSTGAQYSPLCLWSLMLFPYSMSEFLIERQLKKHKLGTLYPNMVEFRPIIPEDENITRIDYFVVNSGKWTVIKPRDYVDVGARFVLNVYTKFPYKVEKASSLAFTGMSVGASTRLNVFDVKGYIKDKTPQKIKLTLAVNEDIVQWNPTITSNLLDSFTVSSWYLNDWDNTLTEGTWIKKTDKVFFKATFKTELYGLETATFGGTECVVSKADNWSDSINIWDIRMLGTIGDLSQVFNLDVYELIRFEDIVQPYPLFFEFTDENGNLISWGGKAKVGSTITRTKGVNYANLLEGLFTITNQRLNGVLLSSFQHVVEKSMVFTCTATWNFDNNEPKCILSPRLLRIPNSSYKILRHIPDISGHGNHGVIHNSAYAGMSGANGYGTNLGYWSINSANTGKIITQREEYLEYEVLGTDKNILFYNTKIENDTFVIYTSVNTNIVYSKESDIIANIPANTPTKVVCPKIGTILLKTNETPTVGNIITVKQDGIYEGAYCFDGVDDFVTIPTTVGGKQVLMKVNWNSYIGRGLLYDQRGYLNEFAIYNRDVDSSNNHVFAYQARNNGQTYIDGILNNNINVSELRNITHNITITNELSAGVNTSSPVIGSNRLHDDFFTNMALYDFMLFDEISTDDKIKELNKYVGIEGNVWGILTQLSNSTLISNETLIKNE